MGQYRIDIDRLAYVHASSFVLQDVHMIIKYDEITIIAGESGCGKTTLLRMLKKQLRPKMELKGTILWEEKTSVAIDDMMDRDSAFWIGYVSQQPDMQLVSDQVWHELAFGLENMGLDSESIHRRIAETVSFLGLEDCYHMPLNELSGGQKQMINLAAVIAMRPKVILLDEPTSQLDPVARQKFHDLLIRIHQSYGIGIIMVEHSLEALLPVCDRVIYLENGRVAYDGDPSHIVQCHLTHRALLPFPARFLQDTGKHIDHNPILDREMRQYMKEYPIHVKETKHINTAPVMRISNVYFRYHQDQEDILRNLSLELQEHEILCLFGGNGSGKTSLLRLLGSFYRKRSKRTDIKKPLLYLPQDPRSLFVKDSLMEEFAQYGDEIQREHLIEQFGLRELLYQHPYDISGGELQRAALALLLLQVTQDVILLLDEPSKGLDMYHREELAKLFKQMAQQHSILMVTHDVEFAALCADRCGFLFDGDIVSLQDTRSFFLDNAFYTTYWRRCTRDHTPCAIAYEEVIG